jgi:hypothetical protein
VLLAGLAGRAMLAGLLLELVLASRLARWRESLEHRLL